MAEPQQQIVSSCDADAPSTPVISQPGPYGYPTRFAVRCAGPKGLKLYWNDPKQPIRYIERHSRRLILRESAHKRDNSQALVTIHTSHFKPRSFYLINKNFTVILHDDSAPAGDNTIDQTETSLSPDSNTITSGEANPSNITTGNDVSRERNTAGESEISPESNTTCQNNASPTNTTVHNNTKPENHTKQPTSPALDKAIDMSYAGPWPGPGTFDFSLPIPAQPPTSLNQGTTPPPTVTESFEWRPASWNCFETRGIRHHTLPPIQTGDVRPPEESFVLSPSGSVLVRLQGKPCPTPGRDRPLGYTREGEEIVASYTRTRDKGALMYFQFWGAGRRGVGRGVDTRGGGDGDGGVAG
ncbi:hypothetical protein N0V88_006768 [Collariella sp. IMI 366227]|nr:hypothetical protein N0V88_006768 [Collariella sp. IMI 366227]